MRIIYIFLVLMLCAQPALGAVATSCSYAHVSEAYTATSSGGTLTIPSGSCTWGVDDSLSITKPITVQGAGVGTIITKDSVGAAFVVSLTEAGYVRISNMYIDKNNDTTSEYYAIKVVGSGDSSFLTTIRLDNITVNKGTQAFLIQRWVNGVIDNNTFINNNISILANGDGRGNKFWSLPIVPGTQNALFIENNTFIVNSNTGRTSSEQNERVYAQDGPNIVVRYNSFDGSAYEGNFFELDIHGNQNLYTGVGNNDFRGNPLTEIYNNTSTGYEGYFVLDQRGGSLLFWGNAFTRTKAGVNPRIMFKEEECWTEGGNFCPTCPATTVWPAEDQVTNTFIWNNTFNNTSITDENYATYIVNAVEDEADFIQKDRDFFIHAPAATGGKSTYTDRPGAAGKGSDGTLSFSASGPNAYYGYTPYTYPHPLRGVRSGSMTGGQTLSGSLK